MADENIMQMSKRGRKSLIPEELFLNMFEIHRSYFDELGKMPSLNLDIIEKFASTFNVSKKTILLKIQRHLISLKVFPKPEKSYQLEKICEEDPNVQEIILSEQARIKLLPSRRGTDSRLQMPLNWTFYVSQLLWEHGIKTECAYVFANSNVVDSELKVTAKCSECLASFHLKSEQQFKKLILIWSNLGLKDMVHKKKRQIRLTVRSEIGKELENKTATVYRRELAASSMMPEDVTPAFIARPGNENSS